MTCSEKNEGREEESGKEGERRIRGRKDRREGRKRGGEGRERVKEDKLKKRSTLQYLERRSPRCSTHTSRVLLSTLSTLVTPDLRGSGSTTRDWYATSASEPFSNGTQSSLEGREGAGGNSMTTHTAE